MAATPYKAVLWGNNEPLATDKLNQMANNSQYLFENMPKVTYSAYGIKKATSVKVIAGIVSIAPNKSLWASQRVEFGSYFSAGCKPVIVTGMQPTAGKWRFQTIVKGIGTYYPDHRGCELAVGADYYGTSVKNVVDVKVYVHYIAIGW